jgi:uncharacterized membrane protein YecN with MAPEG domain
MEPLSLELRYLIYAALWTLVLWVPYILAHINMVGVKRALSYEETQPMPDWARRLKGAHYNAVENLAPFAVVAVAAEFIGLHTGLTAFCAIVFFLARLVHPFAMVSRIWGSRTGAFAVGWAVTIVYGLAVLFSGA